MNQPRIAVIINSLDPVFLNQQNKQGLYIIVIKNTPLETFVHNNFNKDKIIAVTYKTKKFNDILSYEEILEKTDLTARLKENKIDFYIVPHQNSKTVDRWSKRNKIKLIGSKLYFQERLENKIFFDRLLKKNRISSPPTITSSNLREIKKDSAYVVQKNMSFGMFGTSFCPSGEVLYNNIKSHKVKPNNSLIREYLDGESYGVTILIDSEGNCALSELRRQCFEYSNGFPKNFIGVQWTPTAFFGERIAERINSELIKLSKVLAKTGFYGIANVDLLIHQQKPYVIECNPRLSSATQHVFSVNKITSLNNPWKFFINTFIGSEKNEAKKALLPLSKFKGCLLDIDVVGRPKIKKLLPIGVYSLNNKRISYLGDDLKALNQKPNNFFLFHEIPNKNIIGKNYTLATLICNFPLFEIKSGEINAKGKFLAKYFKNQILN
jgi:predicted ATP-grasp superfamily ATP-dependent carboligase